MGQMVDLAIELSNPLGRLGFGDLPFGIPALHLCLGTQDS